MSSSSNSPNEEDNVGGDVVSVSVSTSSEAKDANGIEGQGNGLEEVSSSTSVEGSSVEEENDGGEISSSGDITSESKKRDEFAHLMLPPSFAVPSAAAPSSSSDKKQKQHIPGTSGGENSKSERSKSSSPSSSGEKQKEKLSREKQEKYNAILSNLNYHSPKYGAQCADYRYNLEVLKNGIIVDSITFSPEDNKGYYVVGRIPGCDVVAENPTVSRLHAILQFVQCPPSEEKNDQSSSDDEPQESGLYLFDLQSTHGTFINKNQVFPKKFYRIHVGHVLKFGSSQRMYIVNGPTEDEEEESDKSVTELMNEKLQKDLEKKRLEEEEQLKRTPSSKLPKSNIEEEGIDWGMGEDADEESDMRVNPFAIDYEASDLTLDNPKKTLRSWFERQMEDLEFEMKEKGNGQYICRILLPLDGPTDAPVYAESEVKGKKKEAVHDASFKACQILDSHGLLRGSNQESSRKRKERKYEDEDYYSSDEDTFLDRTGSVEKKREKRMRMSGKVEEKIETYESLTAKYKELEEKITELQSNIDKSRNMKKRADDGEMDIDDYMNMLKTDELDVKKLRSQLKQATEEIQKTKRLMDITKPADLPSCFQNKPQAISTQATSTATKEATDSSEVTPKQGEELNKDTLLSKPKKSVDEKPDIGSASQQKSQIGPLKPPTLPSSSVSSTKQKLYGLILPSSLKPSLRQPDVAIQRANIDALEKDDEEKESSSEEEDGSIDQQADEIPEFIPQSKAKRKRQRNRNKQKPNDPASFDYEDPNYSTWVPPKNQSGDGRTSLNEKLGY